MNFSLRAAGTCSGDDGKGGGGGERKEINHEAEEVDAEDNGGVQERNNRTQCVFSLNLRLR